MEDYADGPVRDREKVLREAGISSESGLRWIWLFDDASALQLQAPTPGVEMVTKGLYVACPFYDRRLAYYEDGVIRPGKPAFFISLDSNLFEVFTHFFSGIASEVERASALAIIRRIRAWKRCDVQGYFYVLEQMAKATEPHEHVLSMTDAILRLHALDLETTIASELPAYSDEIVDRQQQIYPGRNFSERAESAAAAITIPSTTMATVNLMYAALLKAVLINRDLNYRTYEQRSQAFDEFLSNELNLESFRLNAIARYYFAGELRRFFGVEDRSRSDRAIKNLRSAAWDVYYASTPERVLLLRDAPLGALAILCTRDRGLAQVASMFRVKSVGVFADGSSRSVIEWNDQLLIRKMARERIVRDVQRLLTQIERPHKPHHPKPFDASMLEAQLLLSLT